MEEITEGANNMNTVDSLKRNRIQVSNTKKPLFFYVNLAKRYMQQFNEDELSALCRKCVDSRVVHQISENCVPHCCDPGRINSNPTHSGWLKSAVEKKIATSTIDISDDSRPRPVQKARIEIVLVKTEKFDELMATAEERRAEEGQEQS